MFSTIDRREGGGGDGGGGDGGCGGGDVDHIRALGREPDIAARWQAQFGRNMSEQDARHIYQTFMPLQIRQVKHFADPIDGVLNTVDTLRRTGVKIGSCSGYPRQVMDVLLSAAAAKGYVPDYAVASDDLKAGSRPGPWMALQNVIELGINSVSHCVKVDDGVPGIREGLNAGMWTVGVVVSGNEFGVTLEEFNQLTVDEIAVRRKPAAAKLESAGAHYLVDTVADLPDVVIRINQRLAAGEKP